jgi:hypothetical protein
MGLVLLGACPVLAQGPYVRPQTGPASRPALSPYLNLLRNGSPAINYYGLVRPQQEFSRSLQEIQNELHAPPGAPATPNSATSLPITGHPSRFFSHGGYFFSHVNSGAGNARLNGTPTPGATTARPGQPAPAH